ncbi:hypothetical protein DYB32_001168 [Aphanomyces invadans]|uniref:Sister chromatid cohesion protein n=1 Tax=Aphanomyces invadans TaxID=157072 RepID=A0A418B7B8_9STRA|nr:hypothetical protein DYB32_001168 [Aphanomyces invadans]
MIAQLDDILKVAVQKEASIRSQAIACIGLLLTQGLIPPMRCIPTLIALETDQRLPVVAALGYLIYVAQLLSVLPTVQDKMKKFLGKDASFDNLPVTDPVKPELVAVGHSAFGLALLVRLKMALKAAYLLDNEKCQTFQTTNTTKANEAPVSRASLDTAILNVPDMVADDVMNNSWLQLKLLGNAASDDQAQLDFDWENPQLTKKKGVKLHGKRGRKRKEKKADSGDDDDVQVDDIF